MVKKEIMIDGVIYLLTPKIKTEKSPVHGRLGCKDDCIDYPDCHPTCRMRWYHE